MFEQIGVFYRGLVLGLMIAAPVGPIGLLCIRRTIHKGLFIGLATGIGAAIADTIFGAISSFSVAAIQDFVMLYEDPIRIIGGAFLGIVAWHTWFDPPRQPPQNKFSATGAVAAVLSGLVITLTNPVTMFAILAVVATFGGVHNDHEAPILIAGIFGGSTLWWIILSGSVSMVRDHFTENRVILINRSTAVILAILAAYAMLSVAVKHFGMQAG